MLVFSHFIILVGIQAFFYLFGISYLGFSLKDFSQFRFGCLGIINRVELALQHIVIII